MNKVIQTRPPSYREKYLLENFSKESVKQSESFDVLAKEIIKIELIIPSLFVGFIKVFEQPKQLQEPYLLLATVIIWAISIIMILVSIFPRKQPVLREVVSRSCNHLDKNLTIEEFYEARASHKKKFIILSIVLFFLGIILSLYATLGNFLP